MGGKARRLSKRLVLEAGEDLRLRVMRRSDQGELFQLVDRNREHLRPWMPWLEETRTVRDVERFLQQTRRDRRRGSALRMVICERQAIVGTVALESIDWNNAHAKIGYWLAESHQGAGVMTASVRTLCAYGFEVLGLHRIAIRSDPDNARSRAIPTRLGFVHEGCLREVAWHGDRGYHALELFSLLEDEWGSRRDPS